MSKSIYRNDFPLLASDDVIYMDKCGYITKTTDSVGCDE